MTFSDFFDGLANLDWLAVLVATIAVVVLGAIWYSFLFGKSWSAAAGQPYEVPPPVNKIVANVVYILVFNIGVAYTLVLDDFEHALVFGGLVIGVLLVGSMSYARVMWMGYSVKAWLIDLGYLFLAGSVAVYVQGLMA